VTGSVSTTAAVMSDPDQDLDSVSLSSLHTDSRVGGSDRECNGATTPLLDDAAMGGIDRMQAANGNVSEIETLSEDDE